MIAKFKNPSFVNTSEAYSKLGFAGVNCLIIPYINIQLLPDNPLLVKGGYVKYSYYVFKELVEIREDNGWLQMFVGNGNKKRYDDVDLIDEDIFVGSWKNQGGAQLNIKCHTTELYIGDTLLINERIPFIPYDTPNYYQNIFNEEIETFFEYERLPSKLKELLLKSPD